MRISRQRGNGTFRSTGNTIEAVPERSVPKSPAAAADPTRPEPGPVRVHLTISAASAPRTRQGSPAAYAHRTPHQPQLQALTDRMGAIGEDRDASAADVATAWAITKGTTPIIGVTKAGYIHGLARARGIELADEEIAELEALADAADVDTRGWWEHEM
ncbi:aldo/keto reductase [Pseudofrankia asymbiotica]|nr:aldo/keto reductase [Pseudofrankia asymbiotica]